MTKTATESPSTLFRGRIGQTKNGGIRPSGAPLTEIRTVSTTGNDGESSEPKLISGAKTSTTMNGNGAAIDGGRPRPGVPSFRFRSLDRHRCFRVRGCGTCVSRCTTFSFAGCRQSLIDSPDVPNDGRYHQQMSHRATDGTTRYTDRIERKATANCLKRKTKRRRSRIPYPTRRRVAYRRGRTEAPRRDASESNGQADGRAACNLRQPAYSAIRRPLFT